MAVEQARIHIAHKLWGSADLNLKLTFTNEPLSIQVHPGDALARRIGLAHGKCEGLARPLSHCGCQDSRGI